MFLSMGASLHEVKVGMWCAINAECIIGPVFYAETTDRYVRLILREFFVHLTEADQLYAWFVVGFSNWPCHKLFFCCVGRVFGDRINL
jgi:hypothetical protein